MRSPHEIQSRLEIEPTNEILRWVLAQDVGKPDQLAFLISDTYEKAFLNALRHRPNGDEVDKLTTLTWLAGSDLNVADVPWLQYGMPRIRRMAKELKLPFPLVPTGVIYLRSKRMSNGLPCLERCVRCFQGV